MIPCSRFLQIVIGCPPHVDIVKFVSESFPYSTFYFLDNNSEAGRA